MVIKNKILYHILTNKEASQAWENDKEIGFWENHFNLFFLNFHRHYKTYKINDEELPIITAAEKFLEQPVEYQKENYLSLIDTLKKELNEYCMFVRETVCEEIRLKSFPELPSRKKCLFLCSKSNVEYWWKMLKNSRFSIHEVIASGNIHIGKDKYLKSDTVNIDTYTANAYKYWYDSGEESEIGCDILFAGILKIKNTFSGIEEFRESVSNNQND